MKAELEQLQSELLPVAVGTTSYVSLKLEEEMMILADLARQIAADGKTYEEFSPYANSAFTWTPAMLDLLKDARILPEDLKAASLVFSHYRGTVGGKMDEVLFDPHRSASPFIFRGKRVLGFDKVADSGGTAIDARKRMEGWGASLFDQAIMVSKLTKEEEGLLVDSANPEARVYVGPVRVPQGVWLVFSGERKKIRQELADELVGARVEYEDSRGILADLFRPRRGHEWDEIGESLGLSVDKKVVASRG